MVFLSSDGVYCAHKEEITKVNEGATPAGGASLVEWLANGSPCVAY
jgi:hypothetical protein